MVYLTVADPVHGTRGMCPPPFLARRPVIAVDYIAQIRSVYSSSVSEQSECGLEHNQLLHACRIADDLVVDF